MRWVLLAAATLLAACSDTAGPAEVREPGAMEHFDSGPARVEAPDTVVRGETFAIGVRTYGGGCHRQGELDGRDSGRTLELTPFDYRGVTRDACPDVLRIFEHEATLRFEAAGTYEVVVRGRREPGGGAVEVRRQLVVR